MKKEDFQKWANDDWPAGDTEIFEKEIMNNLLEYRLQQEFKLRLQARRVRRMYIKWALFGLLFLGVLAVLFYVFKGSKKSDLGYVEPRTEQMMTPSDASPKTQLNATDSNNIIENSSKGIPVKALKNTIAPLESKLGIQPYEDKNLPEKTLLNIKNTLKSRLHSPIDTEYIYLKSSNEPLDYQRYGVSGDVEKPISNITFLNLSKKKLKEIPPSVFEHPLMRNLQLNNNQISKLPTTIGQLHELEILNLKNNKLTFLPQELTTLTGLKILNLQNNQLKEIPSQIGELTNLVELILNDNKLSEIPTEILKLNRLKNLDLGNNNLKSLPDSVERFTQLELLDLRNNRLDEIPEGIFSLSNLKRLDLGRNKLKSIPYELFEMKNLQFLNLSGNDIPAGEVNRLGEELPNCRIIFF